MLARACLLVCSLLVVAPVFAQTVAISGVVKDPQQAVIPGAQVSLTSTRTAVKETTTADVE